MYIAQAFKVLHDWWRYLIGVFIIIIAVVIGQIPFTIVVLLKAFKDGDSLQGLDETKMLSLLEPNLNLFLMLLSFAVGLGAIFLVVKYLHKQSVRELTTTRNKIDWKRFWFSFFLWGIISSGFIWFEYFMSPEDYVWNFKLVPFLILLVIAVIFLPLQTSFEEYLFRGYLMQGLGVSSIHKKFPFIILYLIFVIGAYLISAKIYYLSFWYLILELLVFLILGLYILNSKSFDVIFNSNFYNRLYLLFKRSSTPLLITSFTFGLLHIANPEVDKLGYNILVFYIGTGLFLGILTLMDEGMELSLGFHAANNLFTALLVTADWTALQTHSILKDMSDPSEMGLTEIFIPVFVVFPILLLIMAKKYGWKNWKDKLFGSIFEPERETINSIGNHDENTTNL